MFRFNTNKDVLERGYAPALGNITSYLGGQWSETNQITSISNGSHSLSDDPVRIWRPQTAKLFRLCHPRVGIWRRWQSQFAVLCLPEQFLRLTRRSLSNGFPLSPQPCGHSCPLLKVQILFLKGAAIKSGETYFGRNLVFPAQIGSLLRLLLLLLSTQFGEKEG